MPPYVLNVATNLSICGFALCTISSFSLIISLAGQMKQAFQVFARAGVVIVILIQWPLWTNRFFDGDIMSYQMTTYAPAGFVTVVAALFYIVMTMVCAWIYRSRIDTTIIAGIGLLLLGQILAIINPVLRQYGFASLMSVAASGILGYRLARMQLFNPFIMQMAQLAALRDVAYELTVGKDLKHVLDAVVKQSRRMLTTDVALIVTRSDATNLVVSAQDGGSVNLVGKAAVSAGVLLAADRRCACRIINPGRESRKFLPTLPCKQC
jgi:hypothetical protein